MIKMVRAFAIVAVLAAPESAWADECGDAVADYNAVIARLTDAMQQFSTCVADSLGLHSCSREFRQLRAAHGEFESAVSVYTRQCVKG